jgi:hypothetical protein
MSLRGFEDLTGRRFGVNVLVLQLSGRNPVRWHVECQKCLSQWIEQHHRLVSEGDRYPCQNVSCRLNKIAPRPLVPPTEKPEPVPIAVTGPKVSEEYTRYAHAMRNIWGQPESNIASWQEFKMLEGKNLQKIMAQVESAELQAESERQWKEFERKCIDEFNEKYGIQ